MSCAAVRDDLWAMADGDAPDTPELLAHLRTCAACRQELVAAVRCARALRLAAPARRRQRIRWPVALAAAVLLALIAGGVAMAIPRNSTTPHPDQIAAESRGDAAKSREDTAPAAPAVPTAPGRHHDGTTTNAGVAVPPAAAPAPRPGIPSDADRRLAAKPSDNAGEALPAKPIEPRAAPAPATESSATARSATTSPPATSPQRIP